jgi:hypothetical protein
MYTYKIGPSNTVLVFVEGQQAPMLAQPNYPNGDAWENKNAAKAWAELFIASISDAEAPYAPIGKGIPAQQKPTPEEIAEHEDRINNPEKYKPEEGK